MARITANELKTRGIAAIESSVRDGGEASISVRGDDRYVVMPIERYHFLRECELEYALAESRADLAAGRVRVESPAAHVRRALELAGAGDGGGVNAAKRVARGKRAVVSKAAKAPARRKAR